MVRRKTSSKGTSLGMNGDYPPIPTLAGPKRPVSTRTDVYRTGDGDVIQAIRPGSLDFKKFKSLGLSDPTKTDDKK